MPRDTDVLLVNPTRIGLDSYLTPPFHLMYLAQALGDGGYSSHIINVHERFCRRAGIEENKDVALGVKAQVEQEAIDEIVQWKARLIGIGSIPSSYEFVERLVRGIKARRDTPIILGGSLGLPLKDLWFKHTEVDYLCEADGEQLIVDLVSHLSDPEKIRRIPGLYWRTGDGWAGNKPDLPVDLDYINAPSPSMIDSELYVDFYRRWVNKTLPPDLRLGRNERPWPVVFSRGCIYNCTFCFHFSRRHRRHSIEYIIEHLKRLQREFGITVVMTMDDLIMANPKWFMDLCEALARESLGIKLFTSGGKANLVTKEMADAMARANFLRISYGIESGSQQILREMQKQATVEDNTRAIKVTADAGVFVHLNMVVGMPGETKQTLEETRQFLIDVVRQNDLSEENVSFAFATPYPGTQLYDRATDAGIIKDTREYVLDIKGVVVPEPILCKLKKDELLDYVDMVQHQIIGIRLGREKRYLARMINAILQSRLSRLAKRSVKRSFPPKLETQLRRLYRSTLMSFGCRR